MLSQTPLQELRFAAIDFESAGTARGETNQPVQVGIATVEHLFAEPEMWVSYIAVERPVHWAAAQVHGISTEMLKNAPTMTALWHEFRMRLSHAVVIGHNPATERKFLRQFVGHTFAPWLDTLALARMCVPGLPNYALHTVCDALQITSRLQVILPDRQWHDALYDAVASLLILRFLIEQLHLGGHPLIMLGKAVSGIK